MKITAKIEERIAEGNVRSMDDILSFAKRTGSHFFDREAMRFFNSRLCNQTMECNDGVLFVTSERFNDKTPRMYTLRILSKDGDIKEISEFQEFKTIAQAKRAMRRYNEKHTP